MQRIERNDLQTIFNIYPGCVIPIDYVAQFIYCFCVHKYFCMLTNIFESFCALLHAFAPFCALLQASDTPYGPTVCIECVHEFVCAIYLFFSIMTDVSNRHEKKIKELRELVLYTLKKHNCKYHSKGGLPETESFNPSLREFDPLPTGTDRDLWECPRIRSRSYDNAFCC